MPLQLGPNGLINTGGSLASSGAGQACCCSFVQAVACQTGNSPPVVPTPIVVMATSELLASDELQYALDGGDSQDSRTFIVTALGKQAGCFRFLRGSDEDSGAAPAGATVVTEGSITIVPEAWTCDYDGEAGRISIPVGDVFPGPPSCPDLDGYGRGTANDNDGGCLNPCCLAGSTCANFLCGKAPCQVQLVLSGCVFCPRLGIDPAYTTPDGTYVLDLRTSAGDCTYSGRFATPVRSASGYPLSIFVEYVPGVSLRVGGGAAPTDPSEGRTLFYWTSGTTPAAADAQASVTVPFNGGPATCSFDYCSEASSPSASAALTPVDYDAYHKCPDDDDSASAPVARTSLARSAVVVATAGPDWSEQGPAMWAQLHTEAAADQAWLNAFVARLPCGSCRTHFRLVLANDPPVFDDGWFAATVRWHNAVNERLGKPTPTVEEARAIWFGGG